MLAVAAPIANVDDVVNTATHTPPGANGEPVQKDDHLVQNEQVQTQPQSAVQMTFVDGSALRLEESSTVVLDNYAFDPNAQMSNGLVNLGAGIFRFTSNGKNDQGVILRTPAATIGIRGTDILINVGEKGVTKVDVLEGEIFLKPLGVGTGTTVMAGQSGMVGDADSDAKVGDIGAFATAAGGPPSPQGSSPSSSPSSDRADHHSSPSGTRTAGRSSGPSGSTGGSTGGTGGTGGDGGTGTGGEGGDGGTGDGGDGGTGDGGTGGTGGDGGTGDGGTGDGDGSTGHHHHDHHHHDHHHHGNHGDGNPGDGGSHHGGGNSQ
ncbi:MAG TPA: FecR family protein [Terriglobia bacterium]|nr:FecR family protein [Terriglobia bacterium]